MAGSPQGIGFAFIGHGMRRWLAVLMVLVVTAGVLGPGTDSGPAAARSPEPGPGQRWGDAAGLSPDEWTGRGNTAQARSLQSKYPPIAGQAVPSPAGNETRVVDTATGSIRGFDAASSRELPEQRGQTQRTFANPDGTETTEFYRDPVNFQRPDGSYQPIDTTLVDSGQGWRNAADSTETTVARTAGAGWLARLQLDARHRIEFDLAGAGAAAGRAEGSTVTYAGVYPGADVRLEVTTFGLKESIVLHSPDTPRNWVFPLRLTGLSASIADGSVVLTDEQGQVRGRIPQGFMVDSHDGEPATSLGVTYSLVRHQGALALRMDLDPAWLADPQRVYPVTVDPPVDLRPAAASMYVRSNGDSLANGDLQVGRSGNSVTASYIWFRDVESALRNHKIHGVQLGITNFRAPSCNARPVTVHPVLAPWTAGPGNPYPGPAVGPALSDKWFAHGFIPLGSTRSPCPTATEVINLGAPGRDLVQRWVNGQQPNHGLSVRASASDPLGWKVFTGAGTQNPPRLAVTHSPYDAKYKFDDPVPKPPVTRTQGGRVKITATNLGATNWTRANYALAYRYFNHATGAFLGWAESASLPQDVPRGGSVTLDALIFPTPPGDYRFEFTMVHRGVAFFTDHQVAPAALAFRVIDVPPVIRAQYPPNGYSAPTLTPSFWAQGLDVDAPPNSTLKYRFEICEPPEVNCFSSERQTSPTWTVPFGRLQWSKTYLWRVFAFDGNSESPALPFSNLLTAVPQPEITAHLGNAPHGGRTGDFDPQVGNYTASAIDATVRTVGPQLSVVRTYNSLDPRRDGMFGAGWSSHYDMRIVPDGDRSGNVVVTYPDGQQARFGANLTASGLPNGARLAAPPGRYATLAPESGGGWTLIDKSATLYKFSADGKLRQIFDNAGRLLELTYGTDGKLATATNKVSNRTLRFTWTGSHVSKVETDPVNGAPLSWTYRHEGDRLVSACDPNSGCTNYDYTPGTHYRSTVVDSKPDSYWRLGEPAGTATAESQIALNLGADKARYSNVALGTPGVLANTDNTAATFNGTDSAVLLPDGLVKKSRELTVEMWFKTTSGGPLFAAQNKPHGTDPTSAIPILYVGNDGKLRGQFWAGQVNPITTAGSVADGNWHHVVLSSSLTSQTLYLDGNTVGTLTGVIDNSLHTWAQIGSGDTEPPSAWPQWGTTQHRFFTGVIDEVAVYQHPLGPPAVQSHYRARTGADSLAQTTLPSGKIAAQLSYDTALDRLTDYTDRNGGTWRLGAPVTTGNTANIIRTVRVTDPGNRNHFYDYDPVRGRILRYLAPLGMDTRPEDRPPTPVPTPPTPPDCQPPFCQIPIGGGPGSFPPVDIQGARTFDYDDNGFQSKIFDENGNASTFTLDQRGNITSRKTCRAGSDCQTTYFEFFPVGTNLTDPRLDKVIAVRDARSSGPTDNRFKTSYVYTQLGQLETQTTADTAVVRHAYTTNSDAAFDGGNTPAGLVKTSTDPRQAVIQYRYYRNGDLAQVQAPTGMITTFTYDALGRRITVKEISDSFPQGVITTTGYDKLGHVTSTTEPAITNSVTGVVHTLRRNTSFDPDGNPVRVELSDLTGGDPTRVATVTYDNHNRPELITDPEGGETSVGYDVFGNRTRMVDANGVNYEYAYTARNMLAEVRLRGWNGDPNGAEPGPTDHLVVASYGYDLAGQRVRATDAMGHNTRYRYYGDGLLQDVTAMGFHNPNGTTRDLILAQYTYDATGSLAQETTAGGRVTTYETDPVGRRIATIQDPNGLARRTALRYDLAGNVTQVTMTGKESNTGAFADGAAEVVDYGYDTAGRRTSQTVHTGTEDLTTQWGYDQRGLLTSTTDPRGTATGANLAAYTTNTSYDQLGRPVTVTAPPVGVETFGAAPVTRRPVTTTGYDTFGSPTDTVDPNGRRSRVGYDKLSRPTSATRPDYTPPGAGAPIVATTRQKYDALGQLIEATGPRGAITRYSFDQLGRLVERTDPKPDNPADPGGVWRYTYTRTGQLLSATDPTGARTEATYDDLGRQITSTVLERQPTPGTFTSTLSYDDAGNLLTATSPTGAVTRYDYDLLGQRTKVTSSAEVPTQLGYDRAGRPAKTTDAAGRAHRTQFDLAGRPIKELDIGPGGASLLRQTQYGYDRAGNLATVTDPLNHKATFTSDALNRLTQHVEPVTDTKSITTSSGYDAAGNRTRYTDGRGNATGYTYNSWGLTESVIEPATTAHPNPPERTWTAGYDPAGNLATMAAPGGVRLDRSYDGLDLLRRVTGSGAAAPTTEKSLGYDLAGRLTTSSAPGGTNTFSYNDRGALITTTGPSGNSGFGYDDDGNLLTRTDAAGTSRYTYTKGRLATMTDGITRTTQTLGYNPSGQLSTVDYGVGRVRTFTYDNLARLDTDILTATTGSTTSQVAGINYDYDDNNWLTTKTTQGVAGAGSNTYGYDHSGRLTSWISNGTTTNYAWDDAGNRTTNGDKSASYDQRNRLQSDGTSTYTYAPRGTLASKATGTTTETLTFDAFDRLIAQGPVRYAYDALDRVATRNAQAFQYTGATNELASDGATTFARGPGEELLAAGSGSNQRLTVADKHDDLVGAFNPATTLTGLTDSTSYNPFGTPTHTAGTPGAIGYQGDYTDPTTKQVNMSARWYNPETSTFTNRDTIDLPTTGSSAAGGAYSAGAPMASSMVNTYTYAAGSPVNYTDPTGNLPVCRYPGGGQGACCPYGPSTSSCSIDRCGFSGAYCPPTSGGHGKLSKPSRGDRPCNKRVNCRGNGGGPGRGAGGGAGRGGGGGGGGGAAATTARAREGARAAAHNNPKPVPSAMLEPAYGGGGGSRGNGRPPVSSAPNVPSHKVGDFRDPVEDVNRSYTKLQESITVPSETVLGQVKDTTAAPTEVSGGGGSGADGDGGSGADGGGGGGGGFGSGDAFCRWSWAFWESGTCTALAGEALLQLAEDIADTVVQIAEFIADTVVQIAESIVETVVQVAGVLAETAAQVVGFLVDTAVKFGKTAQFALNDPFTAGALAWGMANGATCKPRPGTLIECYGMDQGYGARAGMTIGNVFLSGNPDPADERLLAHEAVHAKQWAQLGLAFPFAYLADEMLFGGGNCNHFEQWAGLAAGGYRTDTSECG